MEMAKTLLTSQFSLGLVQLTLNNAIRKDEDVSLPAPEVDEVIEDAWRP